jgi:hypothetical protein
MIDLKDLKRVLKRVLKKGLKDLLCVIIVKWKHRADVPHLNHVDLHARPMTYVDTDIRNTVIITETNSVTANSQT